MRCHTPGSPCVQLVWAMLVNTLDGRPATRPRPALPSYSGVAGRPQMFIAFATSLNDCSGFFALLRLSMYSPKACGQRHGEGCAPSR